MRSVSHLFVPDFRPLVYTEQTNLEIKMMQLAPPESPPATFSHWV